MQLSSKNNSQYKSKRTRLITWSAICVTSIVCLFTFSETAHAGLFSLMASVLGSEQASANSSQKSNGKNSQNMPILAAAVNDDPNPDKPLDAVPVEDGSLVADIAAANAVSDSGSAVISTYTVGSGDTLASIAKMFNVSVNTIVWANNLSRTSSLVTGQNLVILPVSGIKHVVKSGDTIKAVVSKYKADLAEVLQYNDLSEGSKLTVGQTIIIPDGEIAIAAPAPVKKKPLSRSNLVEPLLDGWNWKAIPGYFIRPLLGGTKTQGLHGHNGIDIGAPIGTVLRASAGGTVIISKTSGWNGGYGNFVVISHPNGTQTLYAHMSRQIVAVGATVEQGQTIGYVGNTGLSTGPHVHFEIRGAKNPF